MKRIFNEGFFPEVTKEDVASSNHAAMRVLFEDDLADLRFQRQQTIQRCVWILNDLWARYAAHRLAQTNNHACIPVDAQNPSRG